MSRSAVVVCFLVVGVVAGCDTLFPSGGGNTSGRLTGLDPDGGVCDKDPQTIKNVMLAPPTCNATNPCPCGTFCSSQTGGNCVADCVDDSWCAPGHFCSGYGQCLAGSADGGTGDGGTGPNTDPSCPRNEALLDSLEGMHRSCQFDDICPFGSTCDHQEGRCLAQCRSDAFCAGLNSPGHTFVCNCLGKCAEVAAPRVPPATALPSLELTPSHFTFLRPNPITTPVWGGDNTRQVKVDIMSTFVNTVGMAISGPTATIQATPGPGLMVKCRDQDDFSGGPCTFMVDPTTFTFKNDVFRTVPITLTLKPSDGAPTATDWTLRLESNDVTNAPQTVLLRYDDNLPTQPTQHLVDIGATGPDPSFRGEGDLEFTTPTGAPMKIHVRGRAWNVCNQFSQCANALVVSDETEQISPSGKLVVALNLDVARFIDVASDSDVVLNNRMSGSLPQKITGISLFQDQATGAVKGHYSRVVYADNFSTHGGFPGPFDTDTNVSVVLRPATSTAGFCSQDSDCPVSGRCDLGFCSATTPYRTSASSNVNGQLLVNWFQSQFWAQSLNFTGIKAMFSPSTSYNSLPNLFFVWDDLIANVSGDPDVRLKWTGSDATIEPVVLPYALPLFDQQDMHSTLTTAQLVSACLSEMSSGGTTFNTPSNCVNPFRVGLALGDRVTFQSMLAGVLDVSSFVARNGLEESRLADAIASATFDPNTSGLTSQAPSLTQVLGVTETGLGLFLNAASAQNSPYQSMSAIDIWNTIDYRKYVVSSTECDDGCAPGTFCGGFVCVPALLPDKPHWEQPLGVPTHALRAASSYLKVLDAYLQRTAALTYGQPADSSPANARQTALAHYGTAMRIVLAVEQLAVNLNAAAGIDTVSGTCPGDPQNCAFIAQRFNAIRDELNMIRARTMRDAQVLVAGINPFGIAEDDIPLFFGDTNGTSSRYFAASDYLLTGWAIPAVNQAQSFLDAARASWIQQSQAVVQDELNKHNRQQEIEGLMSKYGAPILGNCGNIQVPDEKAGGTRLLGSTEVIPYFSDPKRQFSNKACFIDQSCGGAPATVDERAELREVINDAFPTAVGQESTDGETVVSNEAYALWRNNGFMGDPFAVALGWNCRLQFCPVHMYSDGNLYFEMFTFFDNTGDAHRIVPMAAFYGPLKRSDIGPGNFYEFASNGWNMIPPTLDVGDADSEDIYLKDPLDQGADDNVYRYTPEILGTILPPDAANSPRLPDRTILPAHCYKGQMGVQFEEVRADLLRIKRAKEVLDSGTLDLQDQKDLCKDIDKHIMDLDALQRHLDGMKADYKAVSSAVDGIKAGFSAGMAGGPYVGIAVGVGTFLFNMFGNSVADEAAHLQEMEKQFSSEEKSRQCWNTFMSQRRALATAMTDIQIATANLFASQVKFQNLSAENVINLQEGTSVLQQEKASPVSSLGHQFWVDEKVDQFTKEFEWSRRLVFMAMRAVEYEFQQSLPYRSQIVAAATPAQLQDAVLGLQQEQGSRTINRRRPTEASVVVSLRDDVLSIADRSDAPAGERNWTPAQRFMSRLYDGRYGYHDSDGNYLGQALPFTLGPIGVLATRCGERLWRATATIQGDGVEPSAPGASVLLLKRNTFSSQYCQGKAPSSSSGAAAQMQVGVIHTSADLFRPGAEVDLTDSNQFTASLLYPWFNIPRTQFYNPAYQQGSSEELAGRGLYGDYVLLFPKEVLDDGFALDKVEDVLLRLDYLSVDNLSQ